MLGCESNTSKIDYYQMLATHMGKRRVYVCQICGKQLSTSNMKSHSHYHTGEKPFKCQMGGCGKTFTEKGNLKTHMRIHNEERPYKCKIEGCESSFRALGHLQDHLRSHSEERPFNCQLCPDSFKRKSTLTTHLRRHTGEKPYSCKQCGKGFTEPGNLKMHSLTHADERAFKCAIPGCGKSFKRKCNLQEHLRTKLHKLPERSMESPTVDEVGECTSIIDEDEQVEFLDDLLIELNGSGGKVALEEKAFALSENLQASSDSYEEESGDDSTCLNTPDDEVTVGHIPGRINSPESI